MVRKEISFFGIFFLLVVSISLSSAFSFWGYTMYSNGTALNATNVTVTIYKMNFSSGTGPQVNSTYSNLSNSSNNGFFNVTDVPIYSGEGVEFFYKFSFIHYNSSNNTYADYMGASMPDFGSQEIQAGMIDNLNNATFYLTSAGTINISAVNATGSPQQFQYQLKDTSLGYPISENFGSYASNVVIHVPVGRNYSVMIYPNMSMPVSTEVSSSTFNYTNNYFEKSFNLTETIPRLTGYVSQSNGTQGGFDSLYVVSYLLEPGRMIYMGDQSMAMFNSSFDGGSDSFNASSGFYNISLIAPKENATMVTFYIGNVSGTMYGGFKSIDLSYGNTPNETNVTLQKLVGSLGNITAGFNPQVALNFSKATINLLNSTGGTINNFVHLEIELDYDDWNMTNFTIMTDVSPGSGGGSLTVPLLNMTGVKRINAFTPGSSPLKKTINSSVVNTGVINLTLNDAFNMEKPDGSPLTGSLYVDMIKDNAACNVPNYNITNCSYFGANLDKDSADPMQVVFSGAPISFVMKNAAGITVIYKSVDLLASGPPDALFNDDSSDTAGSSSFEQAWQFGSTGPEIYDYVIIGVPYTEGSTSVTGFNESAGLNMSIPYLYGDSFSTPLWNGSSNNNNISEINTSSDLVDFIDYLGTDYEAYLNGTDVACNSSDTTLSTGLCYLDTTNNMVWFKIKHFSGLGPSITGAVITAVVDDGGDAGGGGGGGGGGGKTYTLTEGDFKNGYSKVLGLRDKLKFNVTNETHILEVTGLSVSTATIKVTSDPQTATLAIGETKNFELTGDELYDLAVTVLSLPITNNTIKATIKVVSISEPISGDTTTGETPQEESNSQVTGQAIGDGGELQTYSRGSLWWLWSSLVIIAIAVVVGLIIWRKER